MAAHTIACYFKVDPITVSNKDLQKKIEDLGSVCFGVLAGEPIITDLGNSEKLLLFHSKDKSHALVRVYKFGLITMDIQLVLEVNHNVETLCTSEEKPNGEQFNDWIDREEMRTSDLSSPIMELHEKLFKHLSSYCYESKCLPVSIRRGNSVWTYATTGDDRLYEADYDQVLCSKKSKYQEIEIYHSPEFGNVLVLDYDIMIAESDLIYTKTLCCIGQLDYKGKDILILGGGDGGILNELLKEKPKMITMVEIDEEVVKACQSHLRGVCETALDNYKGPHHQIIFDDCIKYLSDAYANGQMFDIIINDLTEYPVLKPQNGFKYALKTDNYILEVSLKVLKPNGRLLSRGNTLSAYTWQDKTESNLKHLDCRYVRREFHVPSYREKYCVYEIWREGDDI